MKNTEEQLASLREDLWTVVEALLEFGGERDANGEYIPGPLQASGIGKPLASKLQSLAAALTPLRGRLQPRE